MKEKIKDKKKKLCVSIVIGTLIILLVGIILFVANGDGGLFSSSNKALLSEIQENIEKIRSDTLYVEAVPGISDDFIHGVDISSIISVEKSGVKFYDEEGIETDIFYLLASSGVNYIRVRVFNDPYDSQGNGYGGGNNDIKTALEIGKRATKHGMKLFVDYHYSDFWADPKKQQTPKAWKGLNIEEKSEELYKFTKETLEQLIKAKVDVGMVQIGNETTGHFSGESNWINIAKLFTAGSTAIREVSKDKGLEIPIAIHFTNPENTDGFIRYGQILDNYKVDYDIFATSYYPFWHGTLENLTHVLSNISNTYQKKILVAETSYAYTYDNGDMQGNTISDTPNFDRTYPITVQGQATAIRDVMEAVTQVGEAGLGVFYWEPAWLPVAGETFEEQSALWETHGSGWASSYASEYDKEDAGVHFGGTSWDNQALFDMKGNPLESLKVFGLVTKGSYPAISVDFMEPAFIKVRKGNQIIPSSSVLGIMSNGDKLELDVVWNESELSKIDVEVLGEYTVNGSVVLEGKEYSVMSYITIMEENYVDNYSFEDSDLSKWKITNNNDITTELGIKEKLSDAKTGTKSLHFYSTNKVDFIVEQSLSGLKPGNYNLKVSLQGGDARNQNMFIYAIVDGKTYTVETNVDGWANWRTPEIKNIPITSGDVIIGASIKCDEKGWGTIDDFSFYPAE